jgi:hypothetical protein
MNGRSAELGRHMCRVHCGIRAEFIEDNAKILPAEKVQRIIVCAAGQLWTTSHEEGTS